MTDLTELANLLTDLKVPGASERLRMIQDDMTDVVHAELRKWQADEAAQRAYTARHGNWWDLVDAMSFTEPDDLPEELRSAYVAAKTAAEDGISAQTPLKARKLPSPNRPPVHVAEPPLEETLRRQPKTSTNQGLQRNFNHRPRRPGALEDRSSWATHTPNKYCSAVSTLGSV